MYFGKNTFMYLRRIRNGLQCLNLKLEISSGQHILYYVTYLYFLCFT